MANKESRLEIRIPEDLKNEAQKVADKKGISVAGLVRMVLIEFIDNENKKRKSQ